MHPIVLLIAIAIFLSWVGLKAIVGIVLTTAAIIAIYIFIDNQSSQANAIEEYGKGSIPKTESSYGDVKFNIIVRKPPNSAGAPSAPIGGNRRAIITSPASRVSGLQGEIYSIGPTSGLIINSAPLEKILSGGKTWEMRSRNTTKRTTVALIEKGKKRILGIATISEVHGPLSLSTLLNTIQYHGISEERLRSGEVDDLKFAWVLSSVKRLKEPIPFQPKSGQVIFATLKDEERMQLSRQLE